MLDVITDFWKPMSRKAQAEEKKVSIDELQVGCTIGFGFVPQASISGRRLRVTGLNLYQFGDEMLESFVLVAEQDTQISLIVAESDGEKYLALSRRLSTSERMKLFEANELDAVIEKADAKELRSKDGGDAYKGWLVPSYGKQIHAHKGALLKGGSDSKEAQEFDYYLLVSSNNEHAIEIERYDDGRVEICATVYRRLSDIGQVMPPAAAEVSDAKSAIKLVASNDAVSVPAPSSPEPAKAEVKPEVKFEAKPESRIETKPELKIEKEKTVMNEPALSSKVEPMKAANESYGRVPQNPIPQENDTVVCEINTANKVIEEAIRTEMRLSDVVRRIVELPVANQDSVQLPITLNEEDFKLLSVRYGIPASDKNAIRRRIVDDINDFTGTKK